MADPRTTRIINLDELAESLKKDIYGRDFLSPRDTQPASMGPGGTQRVPLDQLPDARGPASTVIERPPAGPGNTQPAYRPGGTQRVPLDELPDASQRTSGPRATQPRPDAPRIARERYNQKLIDDLPRVNVSRDVGEHRMKSPAMQSKARTMGAAKKALGRVAGPLALAHAGYEIKQGLEGLAENPGTPLILPYLMEGEEGARRKAMEMRQDRAMAERQSGGTQPESMGQLGPSIDAN